MPFGTRWTNTREVLLNQRFGSSGRTTDYQVATAGIAGADRSTGSRINTLAASQTDTEVDITPFSDSLPGHTLFISTNHEVDIKMGSVSNAAILNVRQLVLATSAGISSVFVTTGPNITSILAEVMGGSNATLAASIPLP